MSQGITKSETPDHSLLYHEFRWAVAWGWTIIGFFSILSAFTSQEKLSSWQIYYALFLLVGIFSSFYFHRRFNSALSYIPVPLILWFSPFFIRDSDQNPWISIGFIAVATIISISNIEDIRIVIPLVVLSIIFQQFIASQDFPSITDSKDLLLLKGYFGVAWCLLIGIGLIYIRQGYIRYHDSIDQQLAKVYENQLLQSKSVLAINTADYRNIQLHGTVLNTLIYIRDNLKLNLRQDRLKLASLISKDIEVFRSETKSEESLERRLRAMISGLGNREIDVWLNPIEEPMIEEGTKAQVIEIIREKILNLKKHTKAENCEIKIEIVPIQSEKLSFIRPTQYRLIIEFKEDSPYFDETKAESQAESAKRSKSLKRLLLPLNALEEFESEFSNLIHRIEIPLINFQPNAIEQLFELRRTSQEFVAKSYVFISMVYGAICLPALMRINAPSFVLILSAIIVVLSFTSILAPRYNFAIIILNSGLALLPLLISVSSSPVCSNLQYLPWIFNGLIGPIFFAVLVIPNKYFRWIPAILFFLESIYISRVLPTSCKELLSGSTPGIIILSLLALLVLNIRKRNTKKDKELVQQYRRESNRMLETKVRIQQEQQEIVELLANFSASIPLNRVSADDLRNKLNLFIMQIRALLVSTEYFDSKIVQTLYFLVKNKIVSGTPIELHILTDKFKEFERDESYSQLEKLFNIRDRDKSLKVELFSPNKTEVRVTRLKANSQPRTFFEDKNVRLLRN